MSEIKIEHERQAKFRWQLLVTVSAIALIGATVESGSAVAADGDSERPSVWIELGGQLSRLEGGQEAFAPPLMANRPSVLSPSGTFEHLPLYSFDEHGKISLQPRDSAWVFSASVSYGRSSSNQHVRQQTSPHPFTKYFTSFGIDNKVVNQPSAAKFADTNVQTGESHTILDFQVGKDVGLGLFGGKNGSSIFSLGVRFAQFSTKSNISLKSDPDWHFYYKYFPSIVSAHRPSSKIAFGGIYHSNAAELHATRSFHGIGPSLSWNASEPFNGNLQAGELSFDWGINAALLFGRQKAITHHQTTGRYHGPKYAQGYHVTIYQHPPTPDHTRSRSVIVPNVGGFAGVSYSIENFKVSAGYRADFFFGAMDGGIDSRKTYDRGFFGPFANVSIGFP